jgi:hypothetical protein
MAVADARPPRNQQLCRSLRNFWRSCSASSGPAYRRRFGICANGSSSNHDVAESRSLILTDSRTPHATVTTSSMRMLLAYSATARQSDPKKEQRGRPGQADSRRYCRGRGLQASASPLPGSFAYASIFSAPRSLSRPTLSNPAHSCSYLSLFVLEDPCVTLSFFSSVAPSAG